MDTMGKSIIEAINESFKMKIPLNKKTVEEVSDMIYSIITEHYYEFCDNCDRKIHAC